MPPGQHAAVVVPGKLQYLDALRGWAILLVLATHAAMGPYAVRELGFSQSNWREQVTLALPFGVSRLAWVGNLGVQLFFVVSAFSLTFSAEMRGRAGRNPTASFAIRRVFRIAPAFYVAIVGYTWAYGQGSSVGAELPDRARDIVMTALFLQAAAPNFAQGVVPGSWSIAEEMTFYCFLPAILTRCSTVHAVAILTVTAFVLCQLTMILTGTDGTIGSAVYYWFPSQFIVFCIGILACRLVLTGRTGFLGSVPGPLISYGAIMTFLAMVFLLPYRIIPPWLAQTHVIFAVLAALLCILLHLQPTPLLVNSVTAAIGRVSFSMYLIHFALLAPGFHLAARLSGPPGGNDTGFFIVSLLFLISGSFFLSQITFRLIEDPGIRFGAWLTRVRVASRRMAGQVPPA